MKYDNEDMVDFCAVCQDDIIFKDNFVFRAGKFYHLKCYHELLEVPLNLEDELGDNFGTDNEFED